MKKFGICLVVIAWSVVAGASTPDTEVVKTFDGAIAHCDQTYDLGKSAYVVKDIAASISTNETLLLSVTAESLLCQVGGWGANTFYSPTSITTLDSTSATLNWKNLEFLVVDPKGQTLGSVPTNDVSSQMLSYEVPVQRLLTPTDRNQLDRGKTIEVRVEFFLFGIANVTTPTGIINMGQGGWGSYVFSVSLQKRGSRIRVVS